MRSKMSGQEDVLQYCRDRLECYIILEKRYGHERARRMLSLYDLERGDAELSKEQFEFDWFCLSCGEHGLASDDKLWKFCRYCGSELKLKQVIAVKAK